MYHLAGCSVLSDVELNGIQLSYTNGTGSCKLQQIIIQHQFAIRSWCIKTNMKSLAPLIKYRDKLAACRHRWQFIIWPAENCRLPLIHIGRHGASDWRRPRLLQRRNHASLPVSEVNDESDSEGQKERETELYYWLSQISLPARRLFTDLAAWPGVTQPCVNRTAFSFSPFISPRSFHRENSKPLRQTWCNQESYFWRRFCETASHCHCLHLYAHRNWISALIKIQRVYTTAELCQFWLCIVNRAKVVNNELHFCFNYLLSVQHYKRNNDALYVT